MASQAMRAVEATASVEARPRRRMWMERVRARKADSALSVAEEEEEGREWVEGVRGKLEVILVVGLDTEEGIGI